MNTLQRPYSANLTPSRSQFSSVGGLGIPRSLIAVTAAWSLSVAALLGADAPLDEPSNRPMRNRQRPVLTIGQTAGDLRGKDDKIIQAGIEYLNRLGGGTLRLLPGRYTLQNSVHLRANITLEGSGEDTILEKGDGVVTALAQDTDWYEYGVRVKDTKGFAPGCGIMLRSSTGPGDWQLDVWRGTVIAVRGDTLWLAQIPEKNFWTNKNATAATIFPLLTGEGVDDVIIRDLVLDGHRHVNEHINGNFSGAVFIQSCNRWRFQNVVAREYNGDGFSFQVCDDVQFQSCQALHNADLGFHPGSGSQRPILRNCRSTGNHIGLFFCWSVSDGLVENCLISENDCGISIGHRDTDNLIRGCTLERNATTGILFRKEDSRFRGGHRNCVEDCTIRDTGTDQPGIGIDIQGQTADIVIRRVRFENTPAAKQSIAIRIAKDAQRVVLQDNTFAGCPTEIEDHRPQRGADAIQ